MSTALWILAALAWTVGTYGLGWRNGLRDGALDERFRLATRPPES